MRLIKIQLGSESFIWTHGDIVLTQTNPESPLIDFDSLTEEDKKIIIFARNRLEISIKNENNEKIDTFEENKINSKCISVDIDDVEPEEDKELEEILNINCVTVGEEPENIKEKEQEKEELDNKILEEAKALLNKNGNTVKKTISNLDITDDYFYKLINSCYNLEVKGKKRKSVLVEIGKKLGE